MTVGIRWALAAAITLAVAAPAAPLRAQVGKSLGVVDANTASEQDLAKMPHMTPAIAKALVGVRPFKSITELNTFLIGQGLTQEQAMEFYQKAFVHINRNTATRDEILCMDSFVSAYGDPYSFSEERQAKVKNVADPLRYRALLR